MTNECVSTKFNGVYQGGDLPRLAELRLTAVYDEAKASDTNYNWVNILGSNIERGVISGSGWVDSTHINHGSVVYITPVYNVTKITDAGYNSGIEILSDLGVFKYSDSLEYLTIHYNGSIDALSEKAVKSTLSHLIIRGDNGYGDISVLKDYDLHILQLNGKDIEGNLVQALGNQINLESVNVNVSTHFTGTFEGIAQAQVAAERVSGSMQLIAKIPVHEGDTPSSNTKTIKYGSSMVNPTAEDTAKGYQII